jgi:hypothetical protein
MRRSFDRKLRVSLAALACALVACSGGGGGAGGGPPPATAVAFSAQPPRGVARSALAPAIQVRAVDASGRTVTSETRVVTLALQGGTPGAALGGTTTVAMVGGVASFSDLAVSRAGSGYALVASSAGLSSATSAAFDVDAALLSWDAGVLDQDLWQ